MILEGSWSWRRYKSRWRASKCDPGWLAQTTLAAVTLSASSGSKDCVDATKKPATDDAKGPDSGSKNMGVTGWSGGDRQPRGGNKAEPNDTGQPATAKGLNPTKDKSTGSC
jgi:hypothetical protein